MVRGAGPRGVLSQSTGRGAPAGNNRTGWPVQGGVERRSRIDQAGILGPDRLRARVCAAPAQSRSAALPPGLRADRGGQGGRGAGALPRAGPSRRRLALRGRGPHGAGRAALQARRVRRRARALPPGGGVPGRAHRPLRPLQAGLVLPQQGRAQAGAANLRAGGGAGERRPHPRVAAQAAGGGGAQGSSKSLRQGGDGGACGRVLPEAGRRRGARVARAAGGGLRRAGPVGAGGVDLARADRHARGLAAHLRLAGQHRARDAVHRQQQGAGGRDPAAGRGAGAAGERQGRAPRHRGGLSPAPAQRQPGAGAALAQEGPEDQGPSCTSWPTRSTASTWRASRKRRTPTT